MIDCSAQTTPEQLARMTPALAAHAPALLAAAVRYQINTPLRLAHWLAQLAHESAGFETMVESLNYSATRLKAMFGRHRISAADADAFGRVGNRAAHQNALANILYGGVWGRENLGNTQPGDGWKFRGRTPTQLTGRSNYAKVSQRIFGDDRLVQNPDLALDPDVMWLIAADFWNGKKLNQYADRDDIVKVTQIVNGGTNGLADRQKWLERAKHALGVK